MSVQVIPKEKQGRGAFNGGEIVENKPIGFPQDHSGIRPYSNLFYWAHARAVTDSTIGLHPHQGFEICSFVLAGEIWHFDTKLREWRPLQAGDVQIIRAGNGISHSEWMGKDAEMFQIWFDPGLTKTLEKPASYDDYRSADFPVITQGGATIRTLVGPGSPFRMDTPGVEVRQIDLAGGLHHLEGNTANIYSVYVLDGELTINGAAARQFDFVLVSEASALELNTPTDAKLFLLASPADPGYRTYTQLRRADA
ncbi:MAG: pirin family protein [Saprospirales bacterium]|nr:pirin family protein [Saprospirales bacterium]